MCLRVWVLYVVHGVVSSSLLLPMIGETAGLYFARVALSFAYGIRLWLCMFYSLVGFVFALCVVGCVGGGKSEKRKRERVSNLVYPFSDFFKI